MGRQGRWNEAFAESKKAVELDPFSSNSNRQLGRLLLYNGQFDEAIGVLQTIFEDTRGGNLYWLTLAYWWKGMHEEAIEWAEKWASILGNPDHPYPVFLRQVASGDRAEAMKTIENWELNPRIRAAWYSVLGEKDLAIEWLTKAIDERYHGVAFTNVEPAFDPLRSDPRFQDLMRRMNLEP